MSEDIDREKKLYLLNYTHKDFSISSSSLDLLKPPAPQSLGITLISNAQCCIQARVFNFYRFFFIRLPKNISVLYLSNISKMQCFVPWLLRSRHALILSQTL